MIRVITLAREHGSGGHEIAERVAAAIGWQLLDHHLVEAVARAARVSPQDVGALDERVGSWIDRLAKALWCGGPESFTQPLDDQIVDADRVAALTRHVIDEAAAQGGCVIVGRGAQCALRDRDDVLRVFVRAPLEARVARLAARLPAGSDPAGEIAEVDRGRRSYVRRFYGCDWQDPACFDLVLDSGDGVDPVVRSILAAVRAGGPVR